MYLVSIRIFSYITSNIIITLRKFIICHPYQIQSFAMLAHYKYVLSQDSIMGHELPFFSYLISLFSPDFFHGVGRGNQGTLVALTDFEEARTVCLQNVLNLDFFDCFIMIRVRLGGLFFFFLARVPHR